MSKKVSIIVITYNAKDDLEECLKSLEQQDYDRKEVLVVNDASIDDTENFLKRYQRECSFEMSVITNKTNKGVAGARNIGIQHAKGELIAFTDSDCVADTRWISELVQGFDQKDIVGVGGRVIHKRISNIWELSEKGHDFVATKEGYVSYVVGCNMSFVRDLLKNYMFNDELKYGYEEALLCDYMIEAGHKIYYRPQAIVQHKHKSTLKSLFRRKYMLGESSIWYRKKRRKLFMFKRHIILLGAILMIPFTSISFSFFFLTLFLFIVFTLSLLRDELIFREKSIREIILALPFVIFIEFSHFSGSISGLIKYRILPKFI